MKVAEPGRVHIGTSGWSYAHWKGLFYPQDIRPSGYFEYYATHFDCVELNSSFYHLPKDTTVNGWINRTPEFFRFCPKLSSYITHRKYLLGIEDSLESFFNRFEPMHQSMGPVLVQLPPGFRYHSDRIFGFLDLLNLKYKSFRFALEIRNRSWINDDFFNLLSKYNMAFVIADSGPRYPYHEVITADFVYLRFHGHERLYASDYTNDELLAYAHKIDRWLQEKKDVWVFFNNDFHGYAIKNAQQLRKILI